MKPTDFAVHLSKYLTSYLPGQRGMSPNTIRSYKDTFCLFLLYCCDQRALPAEKITIAKISRHVVSDFLNWLESDRGNSVATRNQRLAALRAFFRYLQFERPDCLHISQEIISIPAKKRPTKAMYYLSRKEVEEMLLKPDQRTRRGRRDLLVLTLLYDTGARVSELTALAAGDVRAGEFPTIKLTGKGNKTRIVPLMAKTATLVRAFLEENDLCKPSQKARPLFQNPQGNRFTRCGITYILQKYAPEGHEKITPHILRHTKAMHLLQAGVNLIYIRDILGHTDVGTTEIYARADTEMKREALNSVQSSPTDCIENAWQNNTDLMDWLKSLGT